MIDELKHEEEETNEFDKWFQDFLDEDTSDDEPSDDDDVLLDNASADLDTLLAACRSLRERRFVLLRHAKQRVIQRIEG